MLALVGMVATCMVQLGSDIAHAVKSLIPIHARVMVVSIKPDCIFLVSYTNRNLFDVSAAVSEADVLAHYIRKSNS